MRRRHIRNKKRFQPNNRTRIENVVRVGGGDLEILFDKEWGPDQIARYKWEGNSKAEMRDVSKKEHAILHELYFLTPPHFLFSKSGGRAKVIIWFTMEKREADKTLGELFCV